ncbi:3-epi-6-deoxocathasterone 23-monooxygenase, partial [Tanacetum coccineum]
LYGIKKVLTRNDHQLDVPPRKMESQTDVAPRYTRVGQFARSGGEQSVAQLPRDHVSVGHSSNAFGILHVYASIGFTSFGGGLGLCPGLDLARLKASILLHLFVTELRWKRSFDLQLENHFLSILLKAQKEADGTKMFSFVVQGNSSNCLCDLGCEAILATSFAEKNYEKTTTAAVRVLQIVKRRIGLMIKRKELRLLDAYAIEIQMYT